MTVWCCSWRLSKKERIQLNLKDACCRLIKDSNYTNTLQHMAYTDRSKWHRKIDVVVAVYGFIPEIRREFEFLKDEDREYLSNEISNISEPATLCNVRNKIDVFIKKDGLTSDENLSDAQFSRKLWFGLSAFSGVIAAYSIISSEEYSNSAAVNESLSTLALLFIVSLLFVSVSLVALHKGCYDIPEYGALKTISSCAEALLDMDVADAAGEGLLEPPVPERARSPKCVN